MHIQRAVSILCMRELYGHCSRSRLHLRLEQMKAFRPMEGRRCDGTQFEWINLVNYYNLKPSFTPKKIVQNPFLRTPDGSDGRSFRRRGCE